MYQHFSEQRLRVMTAAENTEIPSLDVIRKLPTIQLGISDAYSTSDKVRTAALKILRKSVITPPKGFIGFERQLPDIITGENQTWHLWRVDFYVARLRLYYVDSTIQDEQYFRSGGTAVDSVGHFRSCAYAYLIPCEAIGLDFYLSEQDWHINYEMTCSSPTGAHSAKLTETIDGETTGNFSYNVPHVPEFRP